MADKKDRDVTTWLLVAVALGLVVLGTALYFDGFGHLKREDRRDALAALSAALSATALFAALRGVHLQRVELALQRQELADSRKVMQEQADAAKESARVQARLAAAQVDLARAQAISNELTIAGYHLTAKIQFSQAKVALARQEFERRRDLGNQDPTASHALLREALLEAEQLWREVWNGYENRIPDPPNG